MSFRSSIRTVEVAGTVQTSSTPSGPALRGQRTWRNTTGATQTAQVQTPTETQVGDLLVAYVGWYRIGDTNGNPNPEPGWTRLFTNAYGTSGNQTVFTKVADASDVGGKIYNFTQSSASVDYATTVLAFSGVTAASNLFGSAGTGTQTLGVGVRTVGQIIVWAAVSSPTGDRLANWAPVGSGGPPAPQPVWNGGDLPTGSGNYTVQYSIVNFSVAADIKCYWPSNTNAIIYDGVLLS